MTSESGSFKTVDEKEVSAFNALAASWWDEEGPFKPLHQTNPTRLRHIRDQIVNHFSIQSSPKKTLEGLTCLDVGCGGGLITEPLARMGADITGLDAGEETIGAAKAHAQQGELDINYQVSTAEEYAAGGQQYDVVLALEIIEHVADVELFLKSCCRLLKPGGLLIVSTLNRTIKSFALGIVAAEYVLRWVPKGTHQWKKFLRPSEVANCLRICDMIIDDVTGMSFSPLSNSWSLGKDTDVNYFISAKKQESQS